MSIEILFELVANKVNVQEFRREIKQQLNEHDRAKEYVRAEEAKLKRRGIFKKEMTLKEGAKGYVQNKKALQFLNMNLNAVREILEPVVSALLMREEFYNYLKEKGHIHASTTHQFIIDNIYHYAGNLNVLAGFINFDVQSAHPETLQALARIQGITLYIWQLGKDGELVPRHEAGYAHYIHSENAERVDVLFLDGNHFERLEFVGFKNRFPVDTDFPVYSLETQKSHKEDVTFETFLNQKDKDGNTLLHTAVMMDSFELVEELIGLGVELDTKNRAGKTALEMAKSDHIKALLKTRGDWEKIAKGFSVNRVLHGLNQAASEVESAWGIPKVLLLGASGSGRTTFLNAQLGVDYEYALVDGCKPIAKEIRNGHKAVGLVGPRIYARKLDAHSFCYVDFPGLNTRQTHEDEIIAAGMTQWVTNMPGGIQGILVFIDLPSMQARSAQGLRETADALYKICKGNAETLKSVRYVITKISPQNIKYGLTTKTIEEEFLSPLLEDAKDKNNKSAHFMFEDMINNLNKVFIDDLSRRSGEYINRELKNIMRQSSESFDFMLHDNALYNFRDLLIDLPTKYLEIQRDVSSKEQDITSLLEKIKEKRMAKAAIDTDARVLVHTVHESGFAYKSRPCINVKWIVGAPIVHIDKDFRGWGELSSRMNYPVPTGRGQELDDPEVVGRYDLDFMASEGISEYTVNFYAEERYLPHNRQRIVNLNQEISVLSRDCDEIREGLNRLKIENERLLELEVNQDLFQIVSQLLQDLDIHEVNTDEFISSVGPVPRPSVFAQVQSNQRDDELKSSSSVVQEEAYALLSNNRVQVAEKNLLRQGIRAALLTKDFFEYLTTNGSIGSDITFKVLINNIEKYTMDLNVVQSYLDYVLRDAKVDVDPVTSNALEHIQFALLEADQKSRDDLWEKTNSTDSFSTLSSGSKQAFYSVATLAKASAPEAQKSSASVIGAGK